MLLEALGFFLALRCASTGEILCGQQLYQCEEKMEETLTFTEMISTAFHYTRRIKTGPEAANTENEKEITGMYRKNDLSKLLTPGVKKSHRQERP